MDQPDWSIRHAMSTHMRNAETWSIPGASHWVTFRGRGYQPHETCCYCFVVIVFLLLSLLFNSVSVVRCLLWLLRIFVHFFHIYRPPRRKVNIIYSMPPACRTPKPRCKCEQSATSEKKCKKVNTVNTMNAMNSRALVGPVAICGFFYSCYGTTSRFHFSTFLHAAGESTDQIRWACVGDTVQK